MEGVDGAVVIDGGRGCHNALSEDLPAEKPAVRFGLIPHPESELFTAGGRICEFFELDDLFENILVAGFGHAAPSYVPWLRIRRKLSLWPASDTR